MEQRNKIYKTKQWQILREQVFKLDHNECVRCNHTFFNDTGNKRRTIPVLVHHIYPAKEYPQYKYQIWVNGKRNLVSLCNDCHEIVEGRKKDPKLSFNNEERWD